MPHVRYILVAVVLCVAAAPLRAAEVELSNGDVLRGRLIEVTSDQVTLDHASLGRVRIPLQRVRFIRRDEPTTPSAATATTPPGPSGPAVAAASATAPTSRPAADAALLPPLTKPRLKPKDSDWKLRLELGGSGAQGDTDSMALTLGFRATRKTNLERWRLDAAYYFSSANGDRVRDDATAGALHDSLIPGEIWFPFVQGRYDFREFGEWQHRISFAAGVGLQLLDTPQWDVITRFGAGGSQQMVSPDEEFHPEGSAGVEAVWTLSERQKLSASSTFLPDLRDAGLNRVVSALEWTYRLEELPRTSVKLSISDEYKSLTVDDASHHNAKFIASLVLDF